MQIDDWVPCMSTIAYSGRSHACYARSVDVDSINHRLYYSLLFHHAVHRLICCLSTMFVAVCGRVASLSQRQGLRTGKSSASIQDRRQPSLYPDLWCDRRGKGPEIQHPVGIEFCLWFSAITIMSMCFVIATASRQKDSRSTRQN